MSITWFKLDHNIIGDVKLRKFSPKEKWAWITLLCLSSQSDDRGVITADLEDIADLCDYEKQDFQYLLDKFKTKGMVSYSTTGITILNWDKRQHTKPSDRPEATKERKRRQRVNQKAQGEEMSRDVTPQSRDVTLQIRSDQDLDPDQRRSEEIKILNKSLAQDPRKQIKIEPPKSEPERAQEEFSDQALRAFVSKHLKKTCKVNLSAYVNAALRNNREVWVREYQADQEKRRRNDSERAAIADQPDFVANPIAGVNKSSVSRAEIALRRENFTRQWDSYPERRTQLEALLSHQPELGLFAMDGELCELGEVAA
jgi:hypothetical protein